MDPQAVKLAIATSNAHKVQEYRSLIRELSTTTLPDLFESVASLDDLGKPLDVVESGVTFRDNALLKARAGFAASGTPTLADDSGLIVDVFGSAPGVWSARWAGDAAGDRANVDLLLAQTRDIAPQHRAARFVCALALATQDGEQVWEGEVIGSLATTPAGDSGFGYDPIFIPQGHDTTFAQLGPDVKNQLSHRSVALRKALPTLQETLTQ